jgi:hypothetical protein
MAEESYLWDNPGTGDSPALGYGHTELMTEMFRQFFNGTGNRGVLRNWLNGLEVTDGGGLNAAVDTGGAITYGFWYENDAATTVVMPNNAVNNVVVRCSWAAQTARLTQVAALVQNPGVTYDIPLAQVTTLAGAITLITDTREYCLFSTIPHDVAVESNHIQADAVTPAKLENQDRWASRGAGQIEPDATNAVAWGANITTHPYRDGWNFGAANLESSWCTLRVPADWSAGNIAVYLRRCWVDAVGGDVVWGYNAWIGAAAGALANSAGGLTETLAAGSVWSYAPRAALCNLAVNAGDIIHMEIYRNGAAGGDTFPSAVTLMTVEFEYTADS